MKTIIEPFRTKVVEALRFSTKEERRLALLKAQFNVFKLRADEVLIDLLTDSGTSAMSAEQWAAMMRGDESYAGCESFFRFERAIQDVFGFPEVIPVHQGRAAERIVFGALVREGQIVPSNNHFDTTRANIEAFGAIALDLCCKESFDSASTFPFKGNIDIEKVKEVLRADREKIPFAMLTITNNTAGGQPASLENIIEYSGLLKQARVPFFIDAARFAENSFLIKERSCQYRSETIEGIVRTTFDQADGCLMSAKKDAFANMGGFIALRDKVLAEKLKQSLIISEGFPTYGGLNGRDLEAIAVGIREVLSENYLRYRYAAAKYLANGLDKLGIPYVKPHGMHAIYIDAQKFLPHIDKKDLPGQALVCELYLEAGIRSCEIGTLMCGKSDLVTGQIELADSELVRLALPRRVYSQSHFDYVIEALGEVFDRRSEIVGLAIKWQPRVLRHFTAAMEPLRKTMEGIDGSSCSQFNQLAESTGKAALMDAISSRHFAKSITDFEI